LHDHHAHTHHIGKSGAGKPDANARGVGIAALLTGLFMLVEVAGGLWSGSLALLADAGHMLTDFASLALAFIGFRMAHRPADAMRTYGFDRFSILAAFVNGIALFAIAFWIVGEAAVRLLHPAPVLGGTMLGVAAAGLLVNILAFLVLAQGDRANLNMRGALLHVTGDLLGSVAAIIAAIVIIATGFFPADPILSVLVALVILKAAWGIVIDSGRILLEAAPKGFDREAVVAELLTIEGVAAITHMHAWAITEERPMMTLEAEIRPGARHDEVGAAIKKHLEEKFGFSHATVEIIPRGHETACGCRP
jgi:cobalt-zinc-cadmium efflux system protein